MILAVAKNHR